MNDFDRSLENITRGKKFSLGMKVQALQQLILQRFQALTTISSISFAVAGVIISVRSDLIKNEKLAFLSSGLFIVIAIVSFGRHLYLIRNDINAISKRIKDLSEADWSKPLEEKEFKADWWPETLYVFFIARVSFFSCSHSFVYKRK